MIKLDDTEFSANSIIDLVVLPDMPVRSIIMEMIKLIDCKIILDTQGNLYQHFHGCNGFLGSRENCQSDGRHFCSASDFQNDSGRPTGHIYNSSEINLAFTKNDIPTSSTDYSLDDAELPQLASDMMTSSMDYLSQHFLEMEECEESAGIHYCLVDDFKEFCKKLEEFKTRSNFVLVVDSITFACDSSPFDLQIVINTLWSLVYTCNATIITINHYRVGKIKRTYGLIPRMGARWASFVSYQVLFRYKNDSLVFTVAESDSSKHTFLLASSPLTCTSK